MRGSPFPRQLNAKPESALIVRDKSPAYRSRSPTLAAMGLRRGRDTLAFLAGLKVGNPPPFSSFPSFPSFLHRNLCVKRVLFFLR